MNISGQAVLAVIGAGATVATAIFYAAFYLGQIWHRLASIEQAIGTHDTAIRELQDAA